LGSQIPIALGAQNVYPAESGAFTGEVSPVMLAKLNVRYVIVGHSERREIFGETDSFVNEKLLAVLKHQMSPILCIGETLAERESGTTESKCVRQLEAGFQGVSAEAAARVVVAYEPIWAIGTGRTASAADAEEMCKGIRAWLAAKYSADLAGRLRVQYGGSVTPANIAELMAEADIDGALVGGASLDAERFSQIVRLGRS
jgi:triosephosphate isomerase (TIM)